MPAGAITSDASVSKWGSPRTKGEAPKGSPCLLSAEHEIRVQLRKESGSMFFWLPAEKQKARRFLTKSAGFLEGPLKSIFSRFKKLQEIHPTGLLPAALLRRTSVLPKAKPWRRPNSFPPSILISHGIQKEKDILSDVLFFLEGPVKIDIFQRQPIPPRSGGTPTASPTKWVAVGKEEQGSGRMTSFLPQA